MPVSNFLSKLLKLLKSSRVIFASTFLTIFIGSSNEGRFPTEQLVVMGQERSCNGNRSVVANESSQDSLSEPSEDSLENREDRAQYECYRKFDIVERDGKRYLADKFGNIVFGPMN